MPADQVLVIDAGTSALRAIVVGVDGVCETVVSTPWHIQIPEDAASFGREVASAAVEASLLRLLAIVAVGRFNIVGIACTGQREGIVFLDTGGRAIFASPNIDARAAAEGIAIDAVRGDDIYAATGHLPSLMQVPAKLAWLREHRPAVAANVATVLPLVDWLAMLLTGETRMSRTLAAENGLLDIRTREPADALLGALDFDLHLFPAIVDDGTIVGSVAGGAYAGRRVILAGADTQNALVGAAAVWPGQCAVPAGWSAPLQLVTATPVFDRERRTWTSVHAVRDQWILESNAGETGRAWQWMQTTMDLVPDEAERLAAAAPVGCDDTMSVLGPRAMHAAEMNAGIGAITLPLPLVMLAPSRGHLLRSVLESTAFAIRANLEQLESVSGAGIERLSIGGGMSRSGTFTQIVADVIDRPLHVARQPETSAVGAAVLASVALGLHASIDDAVRVMTGGRDVHPRAAESAAYEDYYARWCSLGDGMQRLASEV